MSEATTTAICARELETIVTDYWAKPIPDRRFDWSAVRKDYEPPMPIGFGRTEQEAIADLINEEQQY